MSLDKNILGQSIYDARSVFCNLTNDQLLEQYGDLETARKAICVAEAGAIINHFTSAALLTIPGLGMIAGTNLVTGESTTGKIS